MHSDEESEVPQDKVQAVGHFVVQAVEQEVLEGGSRESLPLDPKDHAPQPTPF